MQVYYYLPPLNQFIVETDYREDIQLPYTQIEYNNQFVEGRFNETLQKWEEGASNEELLDAYENQKTLLGTLCDEKNIKYIDEFMLPFDNVGFLHEEEAVYGLRGIKLYKDYSYILPNGEKKLIIRQNYYPINKSLTHLGITKNKRVEIRKTIQFFIDDKYFKTKDINVIEFTLKPSELINPENGELLDVEWSSKKNEDVLFEERKNADGVMKSFNPLLYNWIYSNYGTQYNYYLQTGKSSQLIDVINNDTNPMNLFLLNKLVESTDLVKLIGYMDIYPEITIKQLIFMNLQ